MRHGYGVYKLIIGNQYEGEWKEDLKHCKGKFIWLNGDIYNGYYINGICHGVG